MFILTSCGRMGPLIPWEDYVPCFNEIVPTKQSLTQLSDKELILKAEWISTPKNNQVIEFYDNLGFECTSEASESKIYILSLSEYRSNQKDYIEILE